MKQFDAYLFDLDGTLADSKEGIFGSIRYSLKKHGLADPGESVLNSFIGPPLHLSFTGYYGLEGEKAAEVVATYRQRYAEKGMYELRLYPGVENVLRTLKERGRKLAIATSKPQEYTEKILINTGITQYFDFVQGADMAGAHCEKADIVRLCLAGLKLRNAAALMVGDRKYDVIGAKANGLPCAGIIWGYAEKDELKEHGAEYIIKDLAELLI